MPRRASAGELSLALAKDALPSRALYDALRAALLEGRLGPGDRLPSTRDLARQLGVARGTVVGVFDQLRAEGYLEGKIGGGTYVAPSLPDAWFTASQKQLERGALSASPRLSRWGASLSMSPFPTRAMPLPASPFRPYSPALELFPRATWSRLVARHARAENALMLVDADARGYRPLREAIRDHLHLARGVSCSVDHVIIVPSVQFALDLTARLALNPGDAAWIEDPGYMGARAVLAAARARLVPVPVDEGGLCVRLAIERAPDARLAYVTPAHQAPLGVTLRPERRVELLSWAAESGAWIFEDDYDSEFRYEGSPLPALMGQDRSGVVVHAGTFSKTVFPALRLAYAVVPDGLVRAFITARAIMDRYPPTLSQAVLADFIAEGHFGRHLRRMRQRYAERRAALIEALSNELGDEVEILGTSAGLAVTIELRPGLDDRALVRALEAAGIEADALSNYTLTPGRRGGLLLGFAAVPVGALRRGVRTLRQVLSTLLARGGTS